MSKLPAIDPHVPARLQPVHIAKPWGREIWYTGMEARGESRVMVAGEPVALSDYLAAAPAALCNDAPVLLLKVLDPDPAAVKGDLYFEVHEQKREVYVVTHVDPGAWPDGVGGMRFGMCQKMRARFEDEQAFRAAYLQAVTSYEKIRRKIDEDQAPIAPEVEAEARAHMDAFAAVRKLRVGDVVRVPTWTPHALMHGVRVVEFQTPTYERLIISFAQAVVTQDHWDSPAAIERMHIDTPAAEELEPVADGVQRIARFDDFNVWRVDLGAAGPIHLPRHLPYAVCMCLTGTVRVGGEALEPEQACFVPCAALARTEIGDTGTLLVAAPGL